MAVSTTPPDANRPILNEDLTMDDAFRTWTNAVTRELLIIGSGSPEDVVDAIQGRQYMDEDGSTGSLMYRKRNADIGGNTKKGWIAV